VGDEPGQEAGPQRTLTDVAVRGSALNSAQWLVNKGVTAAAMLLVASLLAPEEYGIATQALAIYQVVVVLAPMTVGDVLIAHPRRAHLFVPAASRVARRIGWLMSGAVLVSIPAAIAIYSKYPAAWLAGMLAVLAVRPLIESALVVPLASLRMRLRFGLIAGVDGAVQFLATCASVASAWLGAGAGALIVPQVAAVAFRAMAFRRKADVAIRGTRNRIDRLLFRQYLPAAGAQYVHNALVMLEVLVLGYVCGDAETGLFGLAFTLAVQANGIIAYQLGQILQPIFGHLDSDRVRQLQGFERAQRSLAAVCVPVSVCQAMVAEPIFSLVLPADWGGAAPVFQVLSIGQAFYFATGPTMSCMRAQRQFGALLAWQVIQLACSLPVFFIGARWSGALGVAAASLACWAVGSPVGAWLVFRTSGRGARAALGSSLLLFCRPWVTGLGALLAGLWAARSLASYGAAGDAAMVLCVAPTLFVATISLNRRMDPVFGGVADSLLARLRKTTLRKREPHV
jgi:O-antigen/teichoic acid export membrane protein